VILLVSKAKMEVRERRCMYSGMMELAGVMGADLYDLFQTMRRRLMMLMSLRPVKMR